MSISGVSGVATKTSFALFLLYAIFRSGVLGRRSVNAKALVFSVKGEDLLFLDQPNTRLDDVERARYARLGLRGRPVRLGRLLRPAHPGRPVRPPARDRPDQRGDRVLVDAGRVLRRRAAALRLRRRRGRAQPVHDGHPPGRGPAAARGHRGRRRRGGDRRPAAAQLPGAGRADLRPAGRRGVPPGLGRPGHRHRHDQRVPAPAALQRQAAAHAAARRPPGRRDPPGEHGEPAGHRGRPAQPAGACAAVRGRRRAGRGDRPQGGGRARRAALHHDRRAEQVRPAGGRRARSRRCCWTSPSAAGRWASS